MVVTVHFLWRPVNYTVAHQRYRQTDRTDRQADNGPIAKSLENQLIAEYDMTYATHLGFPTTVPPRQSQLTFVANHSTTQTTTHFRYLLFHWLHQETTIVAVLPLSLALSRYRV